MKKGNGKNHQFWNRGWNRETIAKRVEDMHGIRCACGCDEVIIVPKCHPEGGTIVCYDHVEKAVLVVCSTCIDKGDLQLVVKFKVAEREKAPA